MPAAPASQSAIAAGLSRRSPGHSTRLTTISDASSSSHARPLANAAMTTPTYATNASAPRRERRVGLPIEGGMDKVADTMETRGVERAAM